MVYKILINVNSSVVSIILPWYKYIPYSNYLQNIKVKDYFTMSHNVAIVVPNATLTPILCWSFGNVVFHSWDMGHKHSIPGSRQRITYNKKKAKKVCHCQLITICWYVVPIYRKKYSVRSHQFKHTDLSISILTKQLFINLMMLI